METLDNAYALLDQGHFPLEVAVGIKFRIVGFALLDNLAHVIQFRLAQGRG